MPEKERKQGKESIVIYKNIKKEAIIRDNRNIEKKCRREGSKTEIADKITHKS